jgi:homoserine O-acetyltransferase
MRHMKMLYCAVATLSLAFTGLAAWAQNAPQPTEGTWIVKDFRFHTGEVLPELKLHYTTLGPPTGEPVPTTSATCRNWVCCRTRSSV